jgi:hypothetical protein
MNTDKRQHKRVEAVNLVSYALIDDDNDIIGQGMGRTLNIGQGGILLETHIKIEAPYILLMGIGLECDVIDIKGKVTHSRANNDGKFETGVRFVESNEQIRKIISAFIKVFRHQRHGQAICPDDGEDIS